MIERHMAGPFLWGEADCLLSVANILVELGRTDPAERVRGRYSDEASARALMPGGLAEAAAREAERLSWPEIDLARACDGDVGTIDDTIAIRCGAWWVAKAEAGFGLVRRVDRAWRPA